MNPNTQTRSVLFEKFNSDVSFRNYLTGVLMRPSKKSSLKNYDDRFIFFTYYHTCFIYDHDCHMLYIPRDEQNEQEDRFKGVLVNFVGKDILKHCKIHIKTTIHTGFINFMNTKRYYQF